jgi:hypothetical protein
VEDARRFYDESEVKGEFWVGDKSQFPNEYVFNVVFLDSEGFSHSFKLNQSGRRVVDNQIKSYDFGNPRQNIFYWKGDLHQDGSQEEVIN